MLVALAGCGDALEDDDIDRVEVCGVQEPMQLLSATGDRDAIWGSAVLGDRRIAVWYNDSPIDEEQLPFGAYVLDACGGNAVELSERQFPLVVGEAAFVCDPTDGSIRPFDVDSVTAGEVLATGYDCAPRRRQGDSLLLRNWDENAYGLLRPEGVELLDFELDPIEQEINTLPHAPYLGRWGSISALRENEQHRILPWFGLRLIDLETSKVFDLPEGSLAIFGVEDGENLFVVLSPDDAGESASAVIDRLGDAPRPGPAFSGPLRFFFSQGELAGGVLTETDIFLADEMQSVPLPGPLPADADLVRLDETHLSSITRDDAGAVELAVWDIDSDEGWVPLDVPGRLCGTVLFEESSRAFEGSFSADAECFAKEYWILPIDGTPGRLVTQHDTTQSVGRFELGTETLLRTTFGRSVRDLEIIDIETGAPSTLATDIDGIAWPSTTALPRRRPGEDDVIEYYVRSGDRAGLWITGVPEAF